MTSSLEFWVFLPQMRMSIDTLTARALAAEAAGFSGLAGMDHLAPPGAEVTPMFEAMTTNAWLAARTETLKVGSLVLCDAFRHPAVLARQAVTIDAASGGRFELGLGWGSVVDELETFGVEPTATRARRTRLKESLEIITALWRGESVDYDGEHFHLQNAVQQPGPLEHIPIVIGGAGPKTMELVAAHADWWNVHVGILDRFEEMRPLAGPARCSLQVQVAYIAQESRRADIVATAQRRLGPRVVAGSSAELVDYFGSLVALGVERVYIWFSDFADPDTLSSFGNDVISQFASTP
jgi:alkanesulfonate monooxygenase SsuD/methylene tetrahydromethanopterin reductase-like flavin-dependent oxidoreductase (luciferase family)